MKELIRKILKESDFDWVNKPREQYITCSHFDGNNRTLCKNLFGLTYFLVDDLGLKNIINQTLDTVKVVSDLNDDYQEPLSILHGTGKYPEIKNVDSKFIHDKLINAGIVVDENGEYDYVNKLNTNYADLAELLTELFIRGGKVDSLVNKNQIGLKKYLESIREPLSRLVAKYFNVNELKEFVRNTKYITGLGDDAEDYASEVLENFGMRRLYQGGNGDFIDMLFGIDLIMEYKGRVITCQVKNKESYLHVAMKKGQYRRIDYFISPTENKGGGIIIYNKEGKSFRIGENGERIN